MLMNPLIRLADQYNFDGENWKDIMEQLLNKADSTLYEDHYNDKIVYLPDEMTLYNFDLIYKIIKVPYNRRSARGYDYEILVKLSDLINDMEAADEYSTWIEYCFDPDFELDIEYFPNLIHLNKDGDIKSFNIVHYQSARIIRYDGEQLRLFLLIE